MSEITEKWWPLGSTRADGEIYLRMGLGMKKDRMEAIKCYCTLLQLATIQDLNKLPAMVPFHWNKEHYAEPWYFYIPVLIPELCTALWLSFKVRISSTKIT